IKNLGETDIKLVPLPVVYPAGGEKQLIKALTGLEVPSQGLPLDMGIVCYNVGTIYAVYRAVMYGEPLISRIVTITGKAIKRPRNLEVLIGTPIRELVDQCGGYIDEVQHQLMGGPMMGFTLHGDNLPITKTANCIIAATAEEMPSPQPAQPCIRCGDCVAVCPVTLLPQQLYWYARSEDHDKLQAYRLFDCIECGCCAYVCPSHIPLVQYYQKAKAGIWNRERQRMKSDHLRGRHELHKAHQEREEK
ncbi:MAG: electron transport complex subunit RsxC, partial [Gammaproteobacteria bacterium]|nr:electron transport complex subunit RsxC [Gammaproteobacteria bacterium]